MIRRFHWIRPLPPSGSARRTLAVLALSLLLLPSSSIMAAQRPTTILATLNWEPYVGEEMRNFGFVYELVTEAFKRGGYTPHVKFLPWARALDMTQRGEMDALFPEYYSSSRLENFVYSDPFLGGPVGFYIRNDSDIQFTVDPRRNQLEALQELSQYKFGVVRGYINTDTFDSASFLYKEDVVDDLTNLQRLYYNRVHLIFIDKFVARYLLEKNYPQYLRDLRFLEPPLEVKFLYVAFSKKAPDYKDQLAAFNAGLKAVKKDGTLQEIYTRHGFREVLEYEGELESRRLIPAH
ncbi:ABC-type amino acid transport/signal transduction systems, periplasmic component/domain [Hahella chejuensis KCTC 2396]|uniref:ABC-type amino acid transport/signal transduction systems, periplasmic component/domain n=1 Tax=Hahella chejuensis (strain KCTC 2396) TaxID=349521 RepID=Q2S7E4_HAHCH|nr:transporter substrate-binding domain-containing protein [Hahella chejuensis]ABC33430.1 ABC-type amino acid transport/signal transduction systems, periplasmic component/domain [Hahella chejuensis KCTC 2396]